MSDSSLSNPPPLPRTASATTAASAPSTYTLEYDAYDAILHHIYNQTQGDALSKRLGEAPPTGVCIRVQPGYFRVFPYDEPKLAPFEVAVRALNPVVAIKIFGASITTAIGTIGAGDVAIYLDHNTRIQVLETILHLPRADKEQCAAFIRDERTLVIWTDNLDNILPLAREFNEKLILLAWRLREVRSGLNIRPPRDRRSLGAGLGPLASLSSSMSGISALGGSGESESELIKGQDGMVDLRLGFPSIKALSEEKEESKDDAKAAESKKRKLRFGWRKTKKAANAETGIDTDLEHGGKNGQRKVQYYAPVYGGLAAGLSLYFIGNGISTLLKEWVLDGSFTRFGLILTAPLLFCVSLFFSLQIITIISYVMGPVAQYHENSKFYSARPPPAPPLKRETKRLLSGDGTIDEKALAEKLASVEEVTVETEVLPHITIQMPVYKESLKETITPSVESLKRAMRTYARQGGSSSIFVNDDGLQLLSEKERNERIAFYANHGIGWVARPAHTFKPKDKKAKDGDDGGEHGFNRRGRFKKASNMNYGLSLSLRMERILTELTENDDYDEKGTSNAGLISTVPSTTDASATVATPGSLRYNKKAAIDGSHLTTADAAAARESMLEMKALRMALEEVFVESGSQESHRPWASVAQARAVRVGEIILIVDSDTVVPNDCLRDAARELAQSPEVAIIQHESDVMQVAHHYFENGIAHFTRRINRCISMACANGEVAPFVGHNAFLRWSALQDAAFDDMDDGGKRKIWSESNVSEDFDMALRLQMKGYIIRWASYSNGEFKEGVSLTCDDELNRWQKYAYGCNELLFNPFVQWWRRGPINKQMHTFIWSGAPIHYKISMLSYMFSYYGLAASFPLTLLNYIILGLHMNLDSYYMHSFEIWLACTVVFPGAGNLGYTVLEYRLGLRSFLQALVENSTWVPFFFFFFGGLSIHLGQALLAHLVSYNITWGATKKEVERSNFFIEVPKILRRFWLSLVLSFITILGVIVMSTNLMPFNYRIDPSDWAVVMPLFIVTGCHILYPIVLNPWLMIFSY